ncbi:hypothetical protein ACFLYR_08360 [Chloroflexota bacterium]
MDTTVQTMPKTWKPIVAGILNIVGGALRILGSIAVLIGIMFFIPVATSADPGLVPDMAPWMIPGVLSSIWIIGVVFLLVVGIIPLIGGIYALQRKKWGLALAGSIVAMFGSSVMGILATIFIVMAKDEFE